MTIKNSSDSLRAPFPDDLKPIRHTLTQLLPILDSGKNWYGSIYFERKASKTYTANLKQTQASDHVTLGTVFRIYDGYTLFEEATDDITPEGLRIFVQDFARRVQAQQPIHTTSPKPYIPQTWAQRLSSDLEKEITSQIPADVDAQTPVHFGIRYIQDPKIITPASCFQKLKGIIDQCKTLATQQGLGAQELTYLMSRQTFSEENSIFLDRETNMSQSIYRLSLGLTTMSGPDRTFLRIGGLGGLEAIELKEPDLLTLITDLKSLKSAKRLEPGSYRVLFGPVLTGVLAHEAFGHSQEGDTCARGRSKAWDLYQTGETVGNQHATILNNPAIFENAGEPYGAWGSYFFDEEGWLAQEQVLLKEGRLLAPMTNLTSAIRLGIQRTANGKRESWAHGVYTRQTNTYFSPGDKTLAELMTELNDGFLALHPAGGMEDPKGMGIQVGISYLYEVKGGKLTGQVLRGPAGGDIQMTGYTPDVLYSIIGKSKINFESKAPDHAKHPFNDVGGCGKYHKEFVFAGCGGPYVLLNQVILG
jgi:TldD protein